MEHEITELTELAHEGSKHPLTTTPVVGKPRRDYDDLLRVGGEPVAEGELRVTVLGSGDPFVKRSQASASLLVEVGNPQRDLFFFDLGSGSLANFTGLRLPVTATTKVFLTHLHADHVGDVPTLVWSLAKSGRRDPVELWGPAAEFRPLGTRAYAQMLQAAHAWDMESLCGHPGQSGAEIIAHEVPYDRPAVAYERNGVTITSFPVIHLVNGSVGYRLDYAGRSVVYSGDTRPTHTVLEHADGADLLIHETFPTAEVMARKASMPLEVAAMIIDSSHTSAAMVGTVFESAGARMSAIFHLAVDHETVPAVWAEMRTRHDGPVVISQDLTTFDITADAVVVRQRDIDPAAWPVVGPTEITGPPMSAPHVAPAWWAEKLLVDQHAHAG
ncbi:guanitoxin biosynthesis MBL fold metallo-hydrolase GntH [Leifsonia sp. AG29]|uniref:guanitoxin biosynthesis MBL fold metallo-hydrolase GntH n=1 Tax=Leifsonia sp. AG29 TaxID=2598860 RepID=UPI00131AC245|nr:guanitoxin biosynthesis MBL fold metallo-hydrolase GntH [Leifsonia sp. AG29]